MNTYLQKLHSHSLKLTPRRKAIIALFHDRKTALTCEDVWKLLQKKMNRCGLPGVYRNLETLAGCGILTKIHTFDTSRRYALCTADDTHHHHHIICQMCGKVDPVYCCGIPQIQTICGYQITGHFTQLTGICATCQTIRQNGVNPC